MPTLRGQDKVPSDENSDSENDSQRCTSGGNSSSKICQGGTGTTAIASNNDNSNDRNANANSLARGRPTANVTEEMISSGAAARSGRGRAQAGFDVRTIIRTRGPVESHRRTTVVVALPCVLREDISLQSEDGVDIDQESVYLLRRRTNNGKLDASS